ncbi:class I SAM-dependent methyltransferase [Nonlabens mediterrranea]|uniref:Class I SAM-dependent methyltransferase n=1 Tax=Nonlabens mediterrranea TaxID=1419947 RepID=A0ABS0A2R9_9FLAO|nr:class I SAM-dependent methyltransferase [Nonlabens mediterrranea]
MNQFINISLSYQNFERYIIRRSIQKAIDENMNVLKGSFLDIGCGKMPYRDYIIENSQIASYYGIDIEDAADYKTKYRIDAQWDGIKMPMENNQFDCAIATEVLEHCFEPQLVLNEAIRVLKPGGVLLFTVPFLWNLHETPHDHYRYTPFSLNKHLENSGFEKISIKSTGGWHASLAQFLALWVKRSPLRNSFRKPLYYLIKPLFNFLLKKELKTITKFKDGQMITGLYGVAFKP